MSPQKQLENFAQSIYLTIKNRYFDDIAGPDGLVYIDKVVDWTNMFIDELESEVDDTDQLVDWWFARQQGYELGTVVEGDASISTPSKVDRLITDEERYVQITQDGIVISNWRVVHPKDISSRTERITEDMCAMVGDNIVFSRAFRDTESNGLIVGDVITKLTRLTSGDAPNVKLLTEVKPKLLLILGVSKNATLPDIVQGGLSPSYVQKYNSLLKGAIRKSKATSVASTASRDDFSHIRGSY